MQNTCTTCQQEFSSEIDVSICPSCQEKVLKETQLVDEKHIIEERLKSLGYI